MPPKRAAATKPKTSVTRCSLCFHGKAACKSSVMHVVSIFLQDPDVPTEKAKPLETILGKLSWPKKDTANAQACKLAADICSSIAWVGPHGIPVYNEQTRQCKRLWNQPFQKLVEASTSLPDLISRGTLLHLRSVLEIAASTNVDFKNNAGNVYLAEREFLQKLEHFALSETLKYHDKLSTEELWFLVRRGAADARVRKNMYPGRYLQRWRQLLMDILRMRNCRVKVVRALQGTPMPAELVEIVGRELLEAEGISRPSAWAHVWLVEKPSLPTRETLAVHGSAEEILNRYDEHGEVVWDSIVHRFAWVWSPFGGAVYYGHEPSFHFDPFQKVWIANQRQVAMFGKVFLSKRLRALTPP